MTKQELLEEISRMFATELCDCNICLHKYDNLSLDILTLIEQAGYVQLNQEEASE